MSSSTLSNCEESWMCQRCYRFNTSPETSEQCLSGCGYALGDYSLQTLGWMCPKCENRNTTQLFSSYRCNKCCYKLNMKDMDYISFE